MQAAKEGQAHYSLLCVQRVLTTSTLHRSRLRSCFQQRDCCPALLESFHSCGMLRAVLGRKEQCNHFAAARAARGQGKSSLPDVLAIGSPVKSMADCFCPKGMGLSTVKISTLSFTTEVLHVISIVRPMCPIGTRQSSLFSVNENIKYSSTYERSDQFTVTAFLT